jgi:superfamily II DNA or RNA helicase
MAKYSALSGSQAEELFIDLFCETFGAEKAGYLYTQYPYFDIYQNSRYADFLCETGAKKVAFEIDDESSHNPKLVSKDKYTDDLLKQNSMIYMGWDIYRWTVRQLQKQPDTVKDELLLFLGNSAKFKEIDDYLPVQKGTVLNGEKLEDREYQQEALLNLKKLRENKQTMALLHHAMGTGKTVTAVLDAKSLGGRTLFIVHSLDLVEQAYNTFKSIWSEVTIGKFIDNIKDYNAHVLCGTVQSIAVNLDNFKDNDFDYIIIDEAHHATADTYQKIIAYFKPKFLLGLTATPERADGENILSIFQNTAHKLDLKDAVEMGALAPVRCIRIHTNIDMTKVRFNSVQYNIRDLDVAICVLDRNKLIVDTWLKYVKKKRTVVFCASVKHAKQVADLFQEAGISAVAVSGEMKLSERNECKDRFVKGDIKILCACDLLNEGWDCPETEVLFMARPTMSKVLYTQQIGRGMRNSVGKDYLMVFDFVDNASQFNAPYSLHRLFKLKDYHAGGLVLGRKGEKELEDTLYNKSEKPEAIVDYPVDATDYEIVDIFNWQEEAEGMISQMAFVRMVDVQSETIEKYINEGKIVPDLIVPMSACRTFKYFKEEKVKEYAEKFKWRIIDNKNKKDIFMEIIAQMDMSYSYKPVLIKAVLKYADKSGRIKISDIVDYFKNYYEDRRAKNLPVEKSNSIFAKGGYTNKEAERNILSNPFKRFEDMNMMRHTKTLGIIEVDACVWKNLTDIDKKNIESTCDIKLDEYYKRLN